jgi:arginase family enzyme
VNFTGDGQSLSPSDYAEALASILAEGGIEPDYYSLGGAVTELEGKMAVALGKERAVFPPTGTLANHLAVRIQARGRRRVIVQEESHIYNDSGDCSTVLSDLNLVTLARGEGTFTVEDVEQVLARTAAGRVRTEVGVIVIESPIRRRLGELFDYEEMGRVCRFAREHGIATHLGAAVASMAQDDVFPLGLLGNCNSSLGMLAGLQHAGPSSKPLKVGLIWIDAHADFNTPETTMSGWLGGMPVSVAAGKSLFRLRLQAGLDPPISTEEMFQESPRMRRALHGCPTESM